MGYIFILLVIICDIKCRFHDRNFGRMGEAVLVSVWEGRVGNELRGRLHYMDAVVIILGSHRRDPDSIPCNVTFCLNLEIVMHGCRGNGWNICVLVLIRTQG
jgi:hypothetical protein